MEASGLALLVEMGLYLIWEQKELPLQKKLAGGGEN